MGESERGNGGGKEGVSGERECVRGGESGGDGV